MPVELTVDSVMGLGPCSDYSRGRVEALFGVRASVPLREALEDERIPVEDRVWLGLSAPGPHVQPSLDRIVWRAVESHAMRCGVPEVEVWASRWLSGEDRSESAARAAARAAWADAADAAAWAAMAAAEAAAQGRKGREEWAASAVAWAAADAADAAADAAPEAERRRQLDDLLACLEGVPSQTPSRNREAPPAIQLGGA